MRGTRGLERVLGIPLQLCLEVFSFLVLRRPDHLELTAFAKIRHPLVVHGFFPWPNFLFGPAFVPEMESAPASKTHLGSGAFVALTVSSAVISGEASLA